MAEFKGFTGISEAQLRQLWAYLFKQDSTGLVTDGVLTGLGVAQTTTASTSVVIGLGMGVVQDSVTNGAQPLVSNADKTLDILGPNPMGATPRNDIVVFDAATSSIHNVVGTPNAVPTDPAIAATQLPLARLRHAASATTVPTAKIDDLRVTTSLRPATTTQNIKHGRAVVPGFASSTSTSATVSLSGMGFAAPHVIITSTSIPSGSSRVIAKVSSVTGGTSFNIFLATADSNPITTTSINVDWIAIEG